jgi:elongation factor G
MDIKKIRNIGFAAHIDAGKTTINERILFYTGRIHKMGEVHEGQATMDWMAQEKERGITITAAATYCQWKDHHINIIDTPGHVDFTAEVKRSLRVLDGLVVIICGVGGVEPQSETIWRLADDFRVPRLIYVNKLDRIGASLDRALTEIEEKLNAQSLLLQLPVGEEADFMGVVDLIEMKALLWDKDLQGAQYSTVEIPEELIAQVNLSRERLLETVADTDDSIAELYLSEEEVPLDRLKAAIRKATIQSKLVPVLCGSALRNKGIQPLLDSVLDYLPSPLDVPPAEGINPYTNKKEKRTPSDKEPTSALVFKVMGQAGRKLVYFRVYSGILKEGQRLLNTTRNRKERLGNIFRMHANRQEKVVSMGPGEIGASTDLKWAKTGDTICDEKHPILLETIEFPQPVLSMAIEPSSRSEMDKLEECLALLEDEDPTFSYHKDEETKQMIISGMGELHLDVLSERMRRDHNIQFRTGKPQVELRETITQPVEVTGKIDRVFGEGEEARHLYAEVVLRLTPLEKGAGLQIVDLTAEKPGAAKAVEIVETIKQAIENTATSGVASGYPVINTRVEILDYAYEAGKSTEQAFSIAASMAMKQGLEEGKSVLLEPIMELEVVTPTEDIGDVMGDLSSRGARIGGVKDRGSIQIAQALVPLRKMFGYATVLRSLTKGRGSYTMKFHSFNHL